MDEIAIGTVYYCSGNSEEPILEIFQSRQGKAWFLLFSIFQAHPCATGTSARGACAMGQEIERKCLVQNNRWRRLAAAGVRYVQGYLANNPRCSVRVRVAGEQAWLNIKSAELGVSRIEFDYVVPAAEAKEILASLCERPLIEKTRYRVPHAGREWEIDVFEGENQGLVIAEIELNAVNEGFEKPDWVGEDVSHDRRYYNVCLVKHPYKDW